MKTNKKKELCIDILVDIAAGILIAIGTYNFATTAKFPLSGFNGIGLIFYHLWGLPIGTVALVLNIPVAIACYKTLGKGFMLRSIRSILIKMCIRDSGKKGTKYFYKVQVRVYDASGKLAAKTALQQCRYASRTWNK